MIIIVKTVSDALLVLENLGFNQQESLTKIDNLIKINGVDYALATIEEMERSFYVSKLATSIFLGSDGRYHVFINVDGKRKHMVAKEKKNLENKIVDFYKGNSDKIRQSMTCCIRDIVKDFIKFKELDVSLNTTKKIEWAYNRYIKDSWIETIDMPDITTIQIKEFCLEMIEKYDLTPKGYKELKSILNALFDFAVEQRVLQFNTAKQMSKINTKKLRKTEIVPQTQVFSKDEEAKLFDAAIELYDETKNTSYLAVILSACLGLRAGELVAIKFTDFDFENGEVHIRRQEIARLERSINQQNDDKLHIVGYDVVDYLKTDESKRDLPITDAIERIYWAVYKHNQDNGVDSEYLFTSKDGKKIHASSLNGALRRANRRAGLIQRSNHKLRKTLLSELEHNLGATKTRAYAGHSHNSVILEKNYLYLTNPLKDEKDAINGILNDRMPTSLTKSEQK